MTGLRSGLLVLLLSLAAAAGCRSSPLSGQGDARVGAADAASDLTPDGAGGSDDGAAERMPIEAADAAEASSPDAAPDAGDGYAERMGDLGPPAPQPWGYQVHVQPTAPAGVVFPKDHHFTLAFFPGAAPTIVAGGLGKLVRTEAVVQEDGRHKVRNTFVLRDPQSSRVDPCLPLSQYVYEEVLFSASPTGLEGTVRGHYRIDEGDNIRMIPFSGSITGKPDKEPPAISFAAVEPSFERGPLDPMTRVRLLASEPLPAGLSATLVGEDGAATPLLPEDTDPLAVGGFLIDGRALRFGATYRVVFAPALVDLAGNVTAAPVTLKTGADPGIMSENGFEGETAALLSEGALLSDRLGLPALAGGRSLVLRSVEPGDGRAVFRLRVEPGERTVRFLYRRLDNFPDARGGHMEARLAVPDGGPVSSVISFAPGTPSLEVMEASGHRRYLGPVSTASLALPPGIRDEVYLELRVSLLCGLPDDPGPAALIDDLRVE